MSSFKRWYSRSYTLKTGSVIEIVFYSSNGLTCNRREAFLLDKDGHTILNCTPAIEHLKPHTKTGNLIQAIGAYIKREGGSGMGMGVPV